MLKKAILISLFFTLPIQAIATERLTCREMLSSAAMLIAGGLVGGALVFRNILEHEPTAEVPVVRETVATVSSASFAPTSSATSAVVITLNDSLPGLLAFDADDAVAPIQNTDPEIFLKLTEQIADSKIPFLPAIAPHEDRLSALTPFEVEMTNVRKGSHAGSRYNKDTPLGRAVKTYQATLRRYVHTACVIADGMLEKAKDGGLEEISHARFVLNIAHAKAITPFRFVEKGGDPYSHQYSDLLIDPDFELASEVARARERLEAVEVREFSGGAWVQARFTYSVFSPPEETLLARSVLDSIESNTFLHPEFLRKVRNDVKASNEHAFSRIGLIEGRSGNNGQAAEVSVVLLVRTTKRAAEDLISDWIQEYQGTGPNRILVQAHILR